jgi:flagellar biogenesis protein FliO
MKLADQGRSKSSTQWFIASAAVFFALNASASSLTVREIQVKGNQIEIQLDGVTPKGSLDMDYVRDIVQFSIPNATIYPAKILHADHQAFSKVFAYQYAPNLVRVRFSVDGRADAFKGKVKWQQKGKFLTVSFPTADSVETAKANDTKNEDSNSDAQEKSLLAKVLSVGKKEEVKVEEMKPSEVKAEAATAAAQKSEVKAATKKLTGNPSAENNDESRPRKNLAGAPQGASAFRTFLSMFLVVGGLGLVLIYVKKKKNGAQAKRVGDSWLSGLLPNSMKKQKSFIEVVAQHPLGPKHSITVVKIRGQQFVLAVTPENVQLITQLDSDEAEIDLLEDPAIAASIGKMFGAKPTVQPVAAAPQPQTSARVASVNAGASFDTLLKNSNGAGAIVARNAYAAQNQENGPNPSRGLTQASPAIQAQQTLIQNNGVRDQIKKRLEGMKNA